MVFVELPTFLRCAERLFNESEVSELQNTLLENPNAGDLIQGGKGLRKLRVPLPGRGKSGGARVIYYYWVSQEQCYLIYAYAKNVSADLSKAQLKALSDLMQEVIQNE